MGALRKAPPRALCLKLLLLVSVGFVGLILYGTLPVAAQGVDGAAPADEGAGVPTAGRSSGGDMESTADDAPVQDDEVPVLVSGPAAGRGLPFLSANAIEYYRGLYELPSQNVRVYYTRRRIVPLSSWERRSCGDYRLQSFRADPEEFPEIRSDGSFGEVPGGPLVAFYEADGYALFFSFAGADLSCPFITGFIRKFVFFSNNPGRGGLSIERSTSPQQTRFPPPQFPAVLGD